MPKRSNQSTNVEPTKFTIDANGRKVPARGTRWRARWRTPTGEFRKKTFDRKIDAERHIAAMSVAKATGLYVDSASGRVTLETYAEEWRRVQVHRATTAAYVERSFRRHVYPILGQRPLGQVRPSAVQAWVSNRSQVLGPATVEVVYRYLSAVFRAAVADRMLNASPCVGIKLPKIDHKRVVPLTVEQVGNLAAAMPDRYRALVVLGAGTGLRQGEAFGLTVDRVNFLGRKLTVDRQLVLMPGGGPEFSPPKTDASNRVIPLPETVAEALAAHLAKWPAGEGGLIFTNDRGEPIQRPRFSEFWRPAREAAGLPKDRTFHDLRHFYASLLIRHGESVKVVQERLGHASAAETLNTYSHLWPDSEDRTRAAVDEVLGGHVVSPMCHESSSARKQAGQT